MRVAFVVGCGFIADAINPEVISGDVKGLLIFIIILLVLDVYEVLNGD